MGFHQRSARLSSLVLTYRGRLCLLRPNAVLVLKIKTVYHKSWYWSCLLRPKLFNLGLGLILWDWNFSVSNVKKILVSQISCFHYYSILQFCTHSHPQGSFKKEEDMAIFPKQKLSPYVWRLWNQGWIQEYCVCACVCGGHLAKLEKIEVCAENLWFSYVLKHIFFSKNGGSIFKKWKNYFWGKALPLHPSLWDNIQIKHR